MTMQVAGRAGKRPGNFRGWLGIVICVSALVGCSTLEPAREKSAATAAANAVYVDRFSLAGRLSVRVGDRLDSVRIEWTRSESGDIMRFYSPFGNQLALVTSTATGAVLQRGDVVERADSIGALTLSLLGVGIDPKMLARWIQGFDLGATDRLSNGGVEPADRWTIQAEGLREVAGVDGARVAGRIAAQAGEISLRLVVDKFDAPPAKSQ